MTSPAVTSPLLIIDHLVGFSLRFVIMNPGRLTKLLFFSEEYIILGTWFLKKLYHWAMRGNLKRPSAQVLPSDSQAQRMEKRCVLGVCAAAGVVNQADDRHIDYRLLHNTRVVPHHCLPDPSPIFSSGPPLIGRHCMKQTKRWTHSQISLWMTFQKGCCRQVSMQDVRPMLYNQWERAPLVADEPS